MVSSHQGSASSILGIIDVGNAYLDCAPSKYMRSLQCNPVVFTSNVDFQSCPCSEITGSWVETRLIASLLETELKDV